MHFFIKKKKKVKPIHNVAKLQNMQNKIDFFLNKIK
jgi:hypothetical protein